MVWLMKQFLVKYTAPTPNGTIVGESRLHADTKLEASAMITSRRSKAQAYSIEQGFELGKKVYYGNDY